MINNTTAKIVQDKYQSCNIVKVITDPVMGKLAFLDNFRRRTNGIASIKPVNFDAKIKSTINVGLGPKPEKFPVTPLNNHTPGTTKLACVIW